MKAEINQKGVLELQADNPTEAYALERWFKTHQTVKGIINMVDIKVKEYNPLKD